MSIKVKKLLAKILPVSVLVELTHDDRMEIDAVIERRTGKWCDDGVAQLSDDDLREIVENIRRRKRRRRKEADEGGRPIEVYA